MSFGEKKSSSSDDQPLKLTSSTEILLKRPFGETKLCNTYEIPLDISSFRVMREANMIEWDQPNKDIDEYSIQEPDENWTKILFPDKKGSTLDDDFLAFSRNRWKTKSRLILMGTDQTNQEIDEFNKETREEYEALQKEIEIMNKKSKDMQEQDCYFFESNKKSKSRKLVASSNKFNLVRAIILLPFSLFYSIFYNQDLMKGCKKYRVNLFKLFFKKLTRQ